MADPADADLSNADDENVAECARALASIQTTIEALMADAIEDAQQEDIQMAASGDNNITQAAEVADAPLNADAQVAAARRFLECGMKFKGTIAIPGWNQTVPEEMTPSVAPTFTQLPSYAPSVAPSFSPTFFPTPTSLNQTQLDFHKERASKTQIVASLTNAKQSAIRERVDAITKRKQTAKMKVAMRIQSSLDAKRSALLLLIQKTQHLNEACKDNGILPEAELKLQLHQIRLSPAAVASALHKVAILKSIRNALSKLQNMGRLNGAHSAFAMKKVSENLVSATKEVETKSKRASN